MSQGAELLALDGLSKHFRVGAGFMGSKRQTVHAVDGVSLEVNEHEVLGLVGESGCGKSTLGRLALGLIKPTAGRVLFEGSDVTSLDRAGWKELRRQMQVVFQDPATSLNPRLNVGSILAEPLVIHGMPKAEARAKVGPLLAEVGLRPEHARRYPHQFSGGQRQRIGIARALALRPRLVVADEPVSALDVSIQAQVLNLLMELKKNFGLTYIFVAHDLSVVRHVSDRVAVMYLGKVVELAPAQVFDAPPRHPYTEALLAAAPVADPHRAMQPPPVKGDVASPVNPPSGCRFRTRCPEAREICAAEEPPLKEIGPSHRCACHFR
ncbi:MAG: ATP-binding cassette domain-containing protein [Desulfarculaceae bacterium]|nr:ATP-binding cassette domain-containing protein [Desulfarculaceae bacterium]MCF8073987.1 ATP-binding cassette domain-containing protein [Desulfarculaceae bacterium]MCF8102673.1 ATP-binding cassette domain-containing protein [Desulfarculaceae bacterium]MCF8116086.1 ATP-binding cassette domain-containing protein [Desulfarculaceae bacterium]